MKSSKSSTSYDLQFQAIYKNHFLYQFGVGLSANDFEKRFSEVSEILLNQSVIKIVDIDYRIIEIEFYVYSLFMPDIYTHKHPDQREFGLWHFHRAGENFLNSPKGGNHKGVDLTLGNGVDYIAVLIRGVECLSTKVRTSGPSLFVDIIHSLHNVKSTRDFFAKKKLRMVLNSQTLSEKRKIRKKVRQGLRYKKGYGKEECDYWINKKYRFYTEPYFA